jgi:hypothetical protein
VIRLFRYGKRRSFTDGFEVRDWWVYRLPLWARVSLQVLVIGAAVYIALRG